MSPGRADRNVCVPRPAPSGYTRPRRKQFHLRTVCAHRSDPFRDQVECSSACWFETRGRCTEKGLSIRTVHSEATQTKCDGPVSVTRGCLPGCLKRRDGGTVDRTCPDTLHRRDTSSPIHTPHTAHGRAGVRGRRPPQPTPCVVSVGSR